jgi:hypothetical protein
MTTLPTAPDRCTFFTVADSRYWTGAVALVNSLRLVGHEEAVVVLDAGFTPRQRAILEGAVEIVPAPALRVPFLARWLTPLARGDGVHVLLDADLVAVQPLTSLIEQVEQGRVVAFVDRLATRSFAEWDALVGASQVHDHPYVNSGFLGLPSDLARDVLGRLRDAQERVDVASAALLGRGSVSDPFHFADQDTVNAVLRACVPRDRLLALEHRLAPTEPWDDVLVEDVHRVRCVNPDGSRPYLVHVVGPKPWLANVAPTAYERLLPRLLTGDDVAIRLDRGELPFRLRWSRFVGRDAAPRRLARRLRLRRLVAAAPSRWTRTNRRSRSA